MRTSISEMIQNDAALFQELKDAIRQEIRVSMPGIIHDYDPETQTATVQPAIREKRVGGQYESLPLLLDVPVFFPGNASAVMAFPVNKGDECLVIFSDTCIDRWMQDGHVQSPVTPRRHDLSDGFALVGFRSLPHAFSQSTTNSVSVFVKGRQGWQEPLAVTNAGKALVNGKEPVAARVEGKKLILG